MAPRSFRPKGTRVSVHIEPNLAAKVARSPQAGAGMVRVLAAIGARADETVPRGETGQLAASRETEVQITPAGVVGLIGYLEWYAHFVHNGTARTPANPWLLNAALSVLVTNRGQVTAPRRSSAA